MSQSVGQTYKSRIPTLGDDASIQEALRVYHYGVDNYTTQIIPDDSIEGNFRSLNVRVSSLETQIGTIDSGIVQYVSSSSDPNIVVGENTSTIPLTIKAIASQTVPLQAWKNSFSNTVASVSASGYISTASYIGIGTLTATSSIAVNINIVNASNKGIVVKSATSQSGNLQEWQNSSGGALAVISSIGNISSSNYSSFGSISPLSDAVVFANVLSSSHRGIVVRAAAGQSANIQEWQNSSGTNMISINNNGEIYSNQDIYVKGNPVQTISSLLLIGA